MSMQRALLAHMCLAGLAVASPAQTQPTRPSSGVVWAPFAWAPAVIGGREVPHAALLVPVTLAGAPNQPYYLQLDTGAGWPMWYEVPLRSILPGALRADTTPDELVLRGSIGEYAFQTDTFAVRKSFGELPGRSTEHAVVGTLGLRFFRGRTLVLDLPRQRFAILDSAQHLPPELLDRAVFVPLSYRNGHAFVPLRLAGQLAEDFFYDSGASLFPLTTTAATWRTLTGRAGGEPDNTRWRVSSWGALIEMVGAPVMGPVAMGPLRLERPLVFHQRPDSTQRDFFSAAPYQVGGHFGNALFEDRYVIILDLARRRFGLLEQP